MGMAEREKGAEIAAPDDALQDAPVRFFNNGIWFLPLDEGGQRAAQKVRNILQR